MELVLEDVFALDQLVHLIGGQFDSTVVHMESVEDSARVQLLSDVLKFKNLLRKLLKLRTRAIFRVEPIFQRILENIIPHQLDVENLHRNHLDLVGSFLQLPGLDQVSYLVTEFANDETVPIVELNVLFLLFVPRFIEFFESNGMGEVCLDEVVEGIVHRHLQEI